MFFYFVDDAPQNSYSHKHRAKRACNVVYIGSEFGAVGYCTLGGHLTADGCAPQLLLCIRKPIIHPKSQGKTI